MTWTLALLTFLAGACTLGGLASLLADLRGHRARVNARLNQEFRRSLGAEPASPLFRNLGALAAEAEAGEPSAGWRQRLGYWLSQSGVRAAPGRLVAWSVWLALALGGAGWLLASPWVGGPAALIGLAAPWLYVGQRRTARLARLRAQVPDALEAMARILRAGHTLPQAVLTVAREGRPPLAVEFASCYEQQNLGLSPEDAYRDLARRTDLLELKLFVVCTLVQQQTGGNVAEVLERLAAVVRERLKARVRLHTITAEMRLQSVVLLALPPALFAILFALRRQYVSILFDYPWLILGMAVWQGIGFLWIRKIQQP